ncbi:hypothetical protein STHU_40380 [Allostella humosa]|nr:hypothetical protein STHU_40380 [Stella humosa]
MAQRLQPPERVVGDPAFHDPGERRNHLILGPRAVKKRGDLHVGCPMQDGRIALGQKENLRCGEDMGSDTGREADLGGLVAHRRFEPRGGYQAYRQRALSDA